ncbi:MAG: ATP-binding protein [Myxococcota bacterium]|nr:ATP-binding protein [Myxococcota bacterium]
MDHGEFMPHGHCYFWTPDVLWTNVVADGAIAIAYFTIPVILGVFVRRRSDLAFPWIFLLFGAFILLCGSTHAFDIYTTWVPEYRVEGWLKAATALVSVATAAVLVPLMPKALALPSPDDLRREVQERRAAEDEARQLAERLEERVAERTRELERLNADLREFVHVVSHDLREPLRAVSNFTAQLERRYGDRLDERGREYLELSRDGAVRMQQMLRDLVDYARLDKESLDEEDVSLADVVRDVRADLSGLVEDSSARIEVADDLPTVRASYTHLHQLLTNLVGNAIKYAGDAPPRIRVEADARADGVELRVIDHGMGIAEEHRARVFEMFQRLHTREEIEGSGVGLAICRRIVERLAGTIRIEDTEGGGATFVVWLPARDLN